MTQEQSQPPTEARSAGTGASTGRDEVTANRSPTAAIGSIVTVTVLVVVLAVVAGALLGVLGGFMKVSRLKSETRRLRRQLRTIEKEVVNLRPISMDDAS